MYSFERLKQVLRERQEAQFKALKKEICHMRDSIEKLLEMYFESSSGQSQVNYKGLEMF